jgi:hypothetical protein
VSNYYFLAASLPPLKFGEKPTLSFVQLAARFATNLTAKDLKLTNVLRRFIDINNIRSLYLEEAIDSRGTMTEKELDQALLLQRDFPQYVFDFLNSFQTVKQKLHFFPGLFVAYYREEKQQQSRFFKRYLEFEEGWRLILTAIQSKELGRDLLKELQFHDVKNPLVMHILSQKDTPSYNPPAEFIELKEVYLACGKDPWQKFIQTARWRFNKIDQLVDRPIFSIDWILAYMAKLLIAEEVSEPDTQRGEILLEGFIG